jgi:transcriptional regulator with XRE-family HTH domain
VKAKLTTTEQFNAALGRVLREIRVEAGISQEQMAAKLKVHPNTVSNYERGAGIQTAVFIFACMALKRPAYQVLSEVMDHHAQ